MIERRTALWWAERCGVVEVVDVGGAICAASCQFANLEVELKVENFSVVLFGWLSIRTVARLP